VLPEACTRTRFLRKSAQRSRLCPVQRRLPAVTPSSPQTGTAGGSTIFRMSSRAPAFVETGTSQRGALRQIVRRFTACASVQPWRANPVASRPPGSDGETAQGLPHRATGRAAVGEGSAEYRFRSRLMSGPTISGNGGACGAERLDGTCYKRPGRPVPAKQFYRDCRWFQLWHPFDFTSFSSCVSTLWPRFTTPLPHRPNAGQSAISPPLPTARLSPSIGYPFKRQPLVKEAATNLVPPLL
jgi:hypothetical protein